MERQGDSSAAQAPARFNAGRARWLLFLLMLIYTSNFIDRTILTTLAQPIKQDLGLTDTQLGILGGLAFAAIYTVLGIVLARLAERFHRIGILSVCVAIWSAMTALSGVAQNYTQLLGARLGVGIGEAGCMPTAHSLIADHYPPNRRASALAVFGFGIPLGSLIGAVAGGWIAQNLNWRSAFLVVGIPGLLLALLAPLTLKEPPRGRAEGLDDSGRAPSFWAVLKRMWSRPTVLWVCAGASIAAMGAYGVLNFVAAYFVRRFGFDYAQAGLAAGAISGFGAGVSVLGGGFISDLIGGWDKRAYAWVSAAGVFVAAPLFVLGFMRPDWQGALVLLVLAAIAQQLYLAPTFAVANIVVELRMRATSIALLSAVWSLIGIGLGPLFVGVASDRFAHVLTNGGDVLALCQRAGCADASATGLQYALIAMTVVFIVAGLLFLRSARTMRRDLEGESRPG